jgi:hypothetical protein
MLDRRTMRWLLTGGVIGPVLLVVVLLVEGWTRTGYDPIRMYVSLLALTDQGWQQIADFVVSGVLVAGGAVGLRSAMREGPGSRWGPRLIGLAGLGLVVAGLFVTDPCCGYPPGTPEGLAVNPSLGGTIHDLSSMVVFFGLAIAMVVMARRFRGEGSRWALYSRLSAIGSLGFLFAAIAFADVTGLLQRIAILLAFGWVAQVMWRFRRETELPPS